MKYIKDIQTNSSYFPECDSPMTRILNRLNVSDVSPAQDISFDTPPPNNISTAGQQPNIPAETASNISDDTPMSQQTSSTSSNVSSNVSNVSPPNNNSNTVSQNNNNLVATTTTLNVDNETSDVNSAQAGTASSIQTQSSVETEV